MDIAYRSVLQTTMTRTWCGCKMTRSVLKGCMSVLSHINRKRRNKTVSLRCSDLILWRFSFDFQQKESPHVCWNPFLSTLTQQIFAHMKDPLSLFEVFHNAGRTRKSKGSSWETRQNWNLLGEKYFLTQAPEPLCRPESLWQRSVLTATINKLHNAEGYFGQ